MVCLGMQRAVAAAAGRRPAAHRPAAAAPYRSDLVAAAWTGVRVPVPLEPCESDRSLNTFVRNLQPG